MSITGKDSVPFMNCDKHPKNSRGETDLRLHYTAAKILCAFLFPSPHFPKRYISIANREIKH